MMQDKKLNFSKIHLYLFVEWMLFFFFSKVKYVYIFYIIKDKRIHLILDSYTHMSNW